MFICVYTSVLHKYRYYIFLKKSYNYRIIKIGKELKEHQIQHLTKHHPVNEAIAQSATSSPFLNASRDGDSTIFLDRPVPDTQEGLLVGFVLLHPAKNFCQCWVCASVWKCMGFYFHFIFPTAVDKLLMQGGKRQKMMKMYSTEFSKKIPISKVEQTTDGSCFFPQGSNSKILWDNHVIVKSYTAFKAPD